MKTIAILSGGMDSVTMLHKLHRDDRYDVVGAFTMDYGQRHRREIESARYHCELLGIAHHISYFPGYGAAATCALTDQEIDVPHGHYAEESMKSTVVPNRNMVLIATAAAVAIATGAEAIAYAAHSGDHAIYPDCRPAFVDAMRQALLVADWQPIQLIAPFVDIDKTAIARIGLELGIDYATTWSCYEGTGEPCGKCGPCVERAEVFELAGFEA